MLMVRLSNGVSLPKDVLEAFEKSNNKMLGAIHKSMEDGKLSLRELRTTQFDLKLIQTIIEQNGWHKEGGEFAIIDENGIVYKSNGSNFEVEIDPNGYMHINGDELVVHSHSDGFISGKTKEDVDRGYRRCLEMGFFGKDKNFGEDGFTSTKKVVSAKDIAEADKGQGITTTEVKGINGINRNLMKKYKGKEEK